MLQGEHSTILSTFIKLEFVIKTFVLSIFEWPFYTGFTVSAQCHALVSMCWVLFWAVNAICRSRWAKCLSIKLWIISFPLVLTFVLGTQKNSLIETVLLSTHNICVGWELRKIIFNSNALEYVTTSDWITSKICNSISCDILSKTVWHH